MVMESPSEGGQKGYINGPGHMTKMATTSVYEKKTLKHLYQLGMEHYELKLYTVYINDDNELTLTYFTAISNLMALVSISS